MSRIQVLVEAWVLVPAALVLALVGLGAVVSWRGPAPRGVPGVLLGFVALVAITWLLTGSGATAPLTLPVVIAAALGGAWWLWGHRSAVSWPPVVTGALAYAFYAAPFILSGQPTWAGWIKLDDDASFLAIATRLMEGGREAVVAPASSYELVVSQIAAGIMGVEQVTSYPTGAFTPLGVVSRATGVDAAWLLQPYMALMAALLAVGIFYLLGRLAGSPWLRVLFSVVAAQAAILYGYYLWGGFKEVTMVALLACVALLATSLLEAPGQWKRWLLFAFGCLTFLTVTGTSGLPYVLAPVVGVLVIVAYRSDRPGLRWLRRYRTFLALAAAALAATLVFLPEVPGASALVPRIPDIGNLIYPLEPAQVSGIWPVGDFRLVPERAGLVTLVIFVALVLAVAGTVFAIRRRAWGLPLVTVPAMMVLGRAVTDDQAWLAGKAMAVASPFVLASSFAGLLFLLELARDAPADRDSWRKALRPAAGVLATVIVLGVLVSNALANREVWLAPFEENRELQQIGERFGGQGPTLVPNGAVYATRHFLRDLAAESPSELRTRSLALRGGREPNGTTPTEVTDLQDRELDPFQLIVARRSPAVSVPPPPFTLAYRGRFYDVWRRDPFAPVTDELLPLGSDTEGGAVADCGKVEELAARAKPGAELAYAERARNATIPLNPLPGGPDWPPGKLPGSILPVGGGSVVRTFTTSRFGTYSLWMLGSFPGRLTVELDGRRLFKGSSILAPGDGDAFPLGSEKLSAGSHRLTITYSKPRLLPGSDARVAVADRISGQRLNTDPPSGLPSLGPVVVQPGTPETPGVKTVPLEQAGTLCGRRLDWVASVSRP